MTSLCCITCANPIRPGVHKISCPLCKLELETHAHKGRDSKCQSCILTEHFMDKEYSATHKSFILKEYISMERARAKAEHSLYLAESKKTSIEEKIDHNELSRFNRMAKDIEQALEIQINKLEQINEENFLASELWVRNMKARLVSVYQGCIANNSPTVECIAKMAGNLIYLSTTTELFSAIEDLTIKYIHQPIDRTLKNTLGPTSSTIALVRQNVMDTLSNFLPTFKSHYNIKGILDSVTLAKNIYVGHADLFKIHIIRSGLYILPTVLTLPPKTTLGGASYKSEVSYVDQKSQLTFDQRAILSLIRNKKHRSIIYGTLVLTENSTIFNLHIIGRVYIVGSNVNIINCTIESTQVYSSIYFREQYIGLPSCHMMSKDHSMASSVPRLKKLMKTSNSIDVSLSIISQALEKMDIILDSDTVVKLERDLTVVNPCLIVTNKSTSTLLIKSKVNSNSLVGLQFNISHKLSANEHNLYIGPMCPILISSASQLYIHSSSIFCAQINPVSMAANFQSVKLSPMLEPDTQKSVMDSDVCLTQEYTKYSKHCHKAHHDTDVNKDSASSFGFILTPDRFLEDRETIFKGSLITIKGDSQLIMNDTHLFNSFVGVYTFDSSVHTNTCFINNCCVGSIITDNAYDIRFVYTVFSENGIGTMLHRLRNTSALYLSRYEMSSICGLVISNIAIDINVSYKYRVSDDKTSLLPDTTKSKDYEEDSIIKDSLCLDIIRPSMTQSQTSESVGKPLYNTISLRTIPTLTKSSQGITTANLPDHHCILVSKCDYQASNVSCIAIVEDGSNQYSDNNINYIMLHRNRIEIMQKNFPRGSVILQGDNASNWFVGIPMTNWIIPSANPEEYIKVIPRGVELAQILSINLRTHTATI